MRVKLCYLERHGCLATDIWSARLGPEYVALSRATETWDDAWYYCYEINVSPGTQWPWYFQSGWVWANGNWRCLGGSGCNPSANLYSTQYPDRPAQTFWVDNSYRQWALSSCASQLYNNRHNLFWEQVTTRQWHFNPAASGASQWTWSERTWDAPTYAAAGPRGHPLNLLLLMLVACHAARQVSSELLGEAAPLRRSSVDAFAPCTQVPPDVGDQS